VAEKTSKKAHKQAHKRAHKPPTKPLVKASKKPLPKAAARKVQKPVVRTQKTIHKTSLNRNLARANAPAHAPAPAPHGKTEILTCRDGTEDRHARIGVVLVGGRTDSFAYYSKWKPRTCSIYLQRQRDPYSRWTDKGAVTNVSVERGLVQIEHGKGEYRFVFRDIDRERYCGMDGMINGTLTIRKGSERCVVSGIMEEGTPLGQAYVQLEQSTALATLPPESPSEAPPVQYAAQPSRSPPSRNPPSRSSPSEPVIPRSAD
jgi:hypothetical protein